MSEILKTMPTAPCLIETLPNELIASSLAYLSARELVQIVSVSRCFYTLVTRLLYRRLVHASSLPHNQLILECYHPSAKLSTPTLSCRYLGLKTATGHPVTDESLKFTDLSKLYSSFRPVLIQENRGRRRISSHREREPSQEGEVATQDIYLDDGVLFSQLCASASVVKETSRRGFFISHVTACDGVIRVWRHWLADQASSKGADDAATPTSVDFDRFLWLDPGKNVGLRFRVFLGPMERIPLLSDVDDDSPVSYTLIYEEMIVRTTTLLMAVEATAVQEVVRSTKAVVIAQF